MSENHDHEKTRELTWRNLPSPSQQQELEAWLESHPEAREDFEVDANLTAALDKLANAPVPSNFTARVREQVRLEEAADRRKARTGSFIFKWRWVIRSATAMLLVAAAGVTWKQVESARAAEEIARSVSLVSEIPSLPDPALLRDFEAIQALNQTPPADEELLALLK